MKTITYVLLLMTLTACASQQYIVDTKGVDMDQYAVDLQECEAYRDQLNGTDSVAKSAALGAAIGAGIGAILGNSTTAAQMGGTVAIQAGSAKALENDHQKDRIVKNCLLQRGYKVLN